MNEDALTLEDGEENEELSGVWGDDWEWVEDREDGEEGSILPSSSVVGEKELLVGVPDLLCKLGKAVSP